MIYRNVSVLVPPCVKEQHSIFTVMGQLLLREFDRKQGVVYIDYDVVW